MKSNTVNFRSIVEGLPKRFSNAGFKDFDKSVNPKAFDVCFDYSKNPEGGLLMCGAVGNGKTHLAAAILRNQIHPVKCLFLSAYEFFANMNEAASAEGNKFKYIQRLMYFDMILLDGLEEDNLTPSKLENLYMLVDKIYLEVKKIIITTNIKPDMLQEKMKQVHSRLMEMCRIVVFNKSDYRITKGNYERGRRINKADTSTPAI